MGVQKYLMENKVFKIIWRFLNFLLNVVTIFFLLLIWFLLSQIEKHLMGAMMFSNTLINRSSIKAMGVEIWWKRPNSSRFKDMGVQKSLMGNKVFKIIRRSLNILLNVVTIFFPFTNFIPSFTNWKASYGGYDV